MDYEEKLNLTHESYEAFNRKDLEALLQLYDPRCVWDVSNYAGWPERQVYKGREGLAVRNSAVLPGHRGHSLQLPLGVGALRTDRRPGAGVPTSRRAGPRE
jgi:hypothetical protein